MKMPDTITEPMIAEVEEAHAETARRCTKDEQLRDTTRGEIAALTRARDDAHAKIAQIAAKTAETKHKLAGLTATRAAAQRMFEGARDHLCEEAAVLSDELPELANDLVAAIHDDGVWLRLQTESEVHAAAAADLRRLEEAMENWQITGSRIATLEGQLQELQPLVVGVDETQLTSEVGELRGRLNQLSGEANQAERAAGELRAQCARRAELEPQLARARELTWAYGEIRTALDVGGSAKSPRGRLRQDLIEQIMLSIAEQATKIMGSMRLAIEVAYRRGAFQLKDKRNGRAERRFQEFSGGEQFAISVAVALAVGRVTHGIGNLPAAVRCLFIDEGFGSLDAKNRDSMVTTAIGGLIESGARDQVILITHVADLNESLAYHISLEREGDHTRLVRAGWRADQDEQLDLWQPVR
jgi:DNA repair exonuclease SbcCD ATPase subunit